MRLRGERRWFLEILALTSFVVAQPILDVFGQSPETFLFHGAGRPEMVLFALAVTLVPAVGLWAVAAGAGILGARARRAAQAALIWILLALLAIQVLKRLTPLLGVGLAVTGAAVGALLAWGILRFEAARRWLRWAWPASIAFVLVFLLVSPVSSLVLPARGGAAAVPQEAGDASVVMIVFDQMPLLTILDEGGGIDARRFPNFARLARDATWYRNYTVNEYLTRFSMPTMLSGSPVADRSAHPTTADFPDNLFTLLRDSHEMNVYERFTQLCPLDPCSRAPATPASGPGTGVVALLREAAGIWLDVSWIREVTRDIGAQFEEEAHAEPVEPEPTAEERRQHVLRHRQPHHLTQMLRSITPHEPPTLHFAHMLEPHYPWRFFPSGIEYERPEIEGFARQPDVRPATWTTDSWPVELVRLRHVLQAQFADRLLGDVVARLHELGTYDRTLLLVTSDHGHSFHPGRVAGTTRQENMHELLWVPLLIKGPHQEEGAVDDGNYMSTDLLPTIADHLGLSVPWDVEGGSMLGAGADRGPIKRVGDRSLSLSDAWERLRREVFTAPAPTSEPHPYPIGPRPDLLGEPLSDLARGSPAGWTVGLDLPDAFARPVDRDDGPLPALVSGVARGRASADDLVVVAVNGRIAGISPLFGDEAAALRFATLVPDSYFRDGRNRLELFQLDGEVLRPLR